MHYVIDMMMTGVDAVNKLSLYLLYCKFINVYYVISQLNAMGYNGIIAAMLTHMQ